MASQLANRTVGDPPTLITAKSCDTKKVRMKDDILDNLETILIRQKRELIEVFTGFEQKNRFSILNESGKEILYAAEEGSNFILRNILGALRPYTVRVIKPDKTTFLKLYSPFRFIFQELQIYDENGSYLGKVVRKLSWVHPRFDIYDNQNNLILEINRDVVQLWTFKIQKGNEEVAIILKKWKGLTAEVLSDADDFEVNFSISLSLNDKKIILGALFLVDKNYFEGNSCNALDLLD